MSAKEEPTEVPIAPAPAADDETDEYKVTDRDVIIGDASNTRLANRLLQDLITLYTSSKDAVHANPSKHLVALFSNGAPYSLPLTGPVLTFLKGKGNWVKIVDATAQIASEEEAIKFCDSCIQEGNTKHDSEEMNGDSSKSEGMFEDAPEGATPADHDIKLLSSETFGEVLKESFSKHNGNEKFQEIMDQILKEDQVSIVSLHDVRVKAAKKIFSQIKEAKSRFMVNVSVDAYKVLTEAETIEFCLCCIFDKLLQTDAAVALEGTDLQTLIPTIGTAEISEFMDWGKPGTTPFENPVPYDVLFGRGGMTNNHPGNKRFRDIISLHRPDYVRAIKIEKPNVARRIVAAIRGGNPPGRFLKRNEKDLMWYDVGNRHATEKTSQALREKSNAEKSCKVPTEGDMRKRMLEQALHEARATRLRLSKEGVENGCLDPVTFQLKLPPFHVTLAAGLGGATRAPNGTKGEAKKKSTKDSKEKKNGDSKDLPPLSKIVLDPKDMQKDAGTEITPSYGIGTVDDDGNIVVTENDILCGRGGLTNHHKGNKRFRDIVALHRPDYVRAPKIHKPGVARMIVKAIRNSDPAGRFLKKDDKTNTWYDIGDRRAAEKASQALREKPSDERKTPSKGEPPAKKAKTETGDTKANGEEKPDEKSESDDKKEEEDKTDDDKSKAKDVIEDAENAVSI